MDYLEYIKTRKGGKAMKIEERIAELRIKNPTIMFRRGDSEILVISGTDAHKFSIGFSRGTKEYRYSFQYRTMTALGYTTRNGVTYTYQDGEHDIWVRFQRSKVEQIKDNMEWADYVSYILKTDGGMKNEHTKGDKD
jgi:hypothetical protein